MKKGVVLQERDIDLLKFLAEYKIITLDNARYIWDKDLSGEKDMSFGKRGVCI